MPVGVAADVPAVREAEDGALRVGASGVLLELVIRAFQDGATPEAIVQRYPALALAETYAAVAHILHHRAAMEDYLARREAQAEAVRGALAARQGDLAELRTRIGARRPA